MEEIINKLLEELEKPSTLQETENKKLLGDLETFSELFEYLSEREEEKPSTLTVLCAALDKLDIYKACCISHFCGFLIETVGLGEEGNFLVDFFVKIIKLSFGYLEKASEQLSIEMREFDREKETQVEVQKLFEQVPDMVRAYRGCDMITLAVMDVITRSPECRMKLRNHSIYKEMDELQHFVKSVFYPLQVWNACSNMPLIVLSPELKYGFLAEVNDLCNNFQLLTFLEAELYRGNLIKKYKLRGYQFRKEIYDFVTGAAYPKKNYSIEVHKHYTSYDDTIIWGEMPPETIPHIEGIPIILMQEEKFPRSFDVNFILKWHEALNPYFKIKKELSKAESIEWLDKIRTILNT